MYRKINATGNIPGIATAALSSSVMLLLAGLLFTAGCNKKPTGPDENHSPERPTQMLFVLADPLPYQLWLDGSKQGELQSPGDSLVQDVAAGDHVFHVACPILGAQSKDSTVTVTAGSQVRIVLSNLVSVPPAPSGLSATKGLYADRVSIQWQTRNYAIAPEYWVFRSVAGGSSVFLAAVRNPWYADYAVNPLLQYQYRVQAVWGSIKTSFSNTDTGYRKAAQFSTTTVVCDNTLDRVTLKSDLAMWGYNGDTHALGGYWFRKIGSSYYYQGSNCTTPVPGSYLGQTWQIRPSSSIYSANVWFWLSYSCFKDRTGCYFGEIKLYEKSAIGNVNDAEITRTVYVQICWSSGVSEDPGQPNEPSVHILSESESAALEADIRSAGGVGMPSNADVSQSPNCDGMGGDAGLDAEQETAD